MCFSLCFRVGFSCSFFASSFVFVVTLNHVREGCLFDCGCWLILIGDLGLSMLVWFSSVMCVIGHRDYSLTLIVCDSRRSSVIWFDWESGDWLWFCSRVSEWLLIELGFVRVLLYGYHVIVLLWVGWLWVVDWGWMVGGDLFLIDLLYG